MIRDWRIVYFGARKKYNINLEKQDLENSLAC